MEYYQIIANRIANLCKERNFSINKLAKMSDVKQSTIDNIMHGSSKNPGVQTLHKIAFLDFPELNEFSFDEDEE